MFQPQNRRKLYQYVVEELGTRIIKGQYQSGETLPNEDALCRELDVSRGVLREATKVLIGKGLIQARTKTGTQVQPPQAWNLFDPDVLIWKFKAGNELSFLNNITEVRRIIESEAAGLAAERATDSEVQGISGIFNKMIELLDNGAGYTAEEFIQLDLQFHTAILEACHNDLLAQIGYTLQQALLVGRQMEKPDKEDHRASLRTHLEIARAIADHDPEAAQQAARVHIDEIWSDILRKLDSDG